MAAHTSPLLALAAELRNEIYRLVLTTEGRVNVDKTTFGTRKALVETCSQIRNEARKIFYSEITFLIVVDGITVDTSAKWLTTLGRTAGLIKRLELDVELSDAWLNQLQGSRWSQAEREGFACYMVRFQARHRDLPRMRQALLVASIDGLTEGAVTFSLNDMDLHDKPNLVTAGWLYKACLARRLQ